MTTQSDLTLREQRAETAQALRSEGLKYREIGERMGFSISYVQDLVKDPDGRAVRARKASYAGTCEGCGAATDGSNGRDNAPRLCATCTAKKQHDDRYWTRERIVQWIKDYVAEHDEVPSSQLMVTPGVATFGTEGVRREFGEKGWRKAVREAGFEPLSGDFDGYCGPLHRNHPLIDERLRLYREGVPIREIAARQGVTDGAVHETIHKYLGGGTRMSSRLSPTAVLEREKQRAQDRIDTLKAQIADEEQNIAGLKAALDALALHANGNGKPASS